VKSTEKKFNVTYISASTTWFSPNAVFSFCHQAVVTKTLQLV